jgi:hypothetical protein
MEHDAWRAALAEIFTELTAGLASEVGWVLNPHDPGLIRSLDRLSAAEASASTPAGGASIAAHVDHLRYGLTLLNRWRGGEDPFADADYSQSWGRLHVTQQEWAERRHALTVEIRLWSGHLATLPARLTATELKGVLASVAHLAYHLGAIRQIDRGTRGPSETGPTGAAGSTRPTAS